MEFKEEIQVTILTNNLRPLEGSNLQKITVKKKIFKKPIEPMMKALMVVKKILQDKQAKLF